MRSGFPMRRTTKQRLIPTARPLPPGEREKAAAVAPSFLLPSREKDRMRGPRGQEIWRLVFHQKRLGGFSPACHQSALKKAPLGSMQRKTGGDILQRSPQLPYQPRACILGLDLTAHRPRGLLHEYGIAEPSMRVASSCRAIPSICAASGLTLTKGPANVTWSLASANGSKCVSKSS